MPTSPTLTHAIESLQHGVEHYLEGSPKSRKFAFLHMDHSVELVLKEKIVSCGKTIFKTDGTTLNFHESFRSLERENVAISERPRLEELHDLRNTIQHRGLTPDEALTEFYVKEAYSFLDRFLSAELGVRIQELLPPRIVQIMTGRPLISTTESVNDLFVEAERRLTSNPIQSLISSYTAMEIAVSGYADTLRGDSRSGLSELIQMLQERGRLTADEATQFHEIRTLRNRVIHERYIPSVGDCRNTLSFARNVVARIMVDR